MNYDTWKTTPPRTFCDCGVDHDEHAALDCITCGGCVVEREHDEVVSIDTTQGTICGSCLAGDAAGDAHYVECPACSEPDLLVRPGLTLAVCTHPDCEAVGRVVVAP